MTGLTNEERMLAETVYKWALNELAPIQEEIDEQDKLPDDFFKKLGQLGILGITIDEKYGGSGQGIMMQTLAVEQISRICPGPGMSYGAHSNLCANNIHKNGNETQKSTYLPSMCTGEHIGALCLTEPGAGSDALSGMRTHAGKEGDKYILNGTKMFITNGSIADILLVYAKTDPERGAHGISAFIVEANSPGVSVSKKLKKCGMRGSPTSELIFEDVEVPAENMLYEENKGVNVVTSGLAYERIVLSGGSLGMAEQALEYSIQYAKEREQFGRPIKDFEMIQQKIADMYCLVEASRGLVYRAAQFADGPQGKQGGKGTELDKLAAAAILFTAESATKVACDGVQIHGGYGYCLEYPIQKLWRDAKLYEIGAGTSEIRRIIIARELFR
ncbi:MAG: acyl-CoA dehydrogenase family protein [Thermodesulfobacteriota bacterium]|nr:acyl-CoA dehydrogenase family protein [Thermodesulfobacteriota bacterium]